MTSDFRMIAEYVACKKNPKAMKKLFKDKKYKVKHPEEFWDMLSEVANDVQYKKLKEELREDERGEITMCWMADKLVGQGRQQGMQQGKLTANTTLTDRYETILEAKQHHR